MATPKPTILVIEDEPALQKFLRLTLGTQDYAVIEAETGEQGLRHAAISAPDLVILDLGLPDMDGTEVTRRLREWSAIPILIVSARGKEQAKVAALDAGADDYLTKPFGVAELLARIRVALRHRAAANPQTGDPVFEVGDLRVDLSRRDLHRERIRRREAEPERLALIHGHHDPAALEPGGRSRRGKVVHGTEGERADAGGQRVRPAVVGNPQGALKGDGQGRERFVLQSGGA